ncbi:ketohydroxyglutarate aldolase [Arachidicoccus ginsenosidimutans]|uniref:bifunctional 4-hydroxy-2-oxoglutarate aldolase/2-dehydro-3-deoxy-phosphogluconate aldolase n=1 Tax=Arachidicoccus sp. BS20 TaxID=1850526 RepID=UPI0007F07648|nr:ketohydroxyglutarate aldolase [Arachidicoccus sp. BS20]ANI88391.1 ketohydroxyglutarate aldolase [Arachidicoccus sp. BS20]
MNNKIFEAIKQQGILPLYFHPNEEVSLNVMKALYSAGIRIVEYTNRGGEALSNFKKIIEAKSQDFPEMILGVGTIKNSDDAENYLDAGADFLVSPCYSKEVWKVVKSREATWIPGCMTPTEINNAELKSVKFVKLFPGHLLQPAFVSAVKDLFPGMNFMPTGGVDMDEKNIEDWFKSGVVAVGMGSKLISKKLMQSEDYDAIKSLAKKALDIVQSVKNKL